MNEKKFSQSFLYTLVRENMKQLRKDSGLTQTQVAQKIGVTLQHYQQIESGGSPPNLRIIYKLCEAFNVHPGYFFTDINLSLIDQEGNILARELSTEDIIALRSATGLSPEAKKSVLEYIKFKHFEALNKEMKDQEEPKNK
ncbi:MAG: hypothetical protein AVO34_05255 [Firmicutes bacterium ML8_F2]|nr:MAG: hypothetical protein AVO34_05255 [Firmicutes bacterium ML8_F2]